jgi:N-acetylglucosamine-6-phosphate deacetylase
LRLDDHIGSIAVGKRANLIIFDDDLRGVRTFLGGHEVHA